MNTQISDWPLGAKVASFIEEPKPLIISGRMQIQWNNSASNQTTDRDTIPYRWLMANLKVYGIKNLCIADGSIMPRVTTGNTMAPCVIIGERAGEILKADHKL